MTISFTDNLRSDDKSLPSRNKPFQTTTKALGFIDRSKLLKPYNVVCSNNFFQYVVADVTDKAVRLNYKQFHLEAVILDLKSIPST